MATEIGKQQRWKPTATVDGEAQSQRSRQHGTATVTTNGGDDSKQRTETVIYDGDNGQAASDDSTPTADVDGSIDSGLLRRGRRGRYISSAGRDK